MPLLLTHRGKVGADTKTYLYLNPGKLLSRSLQMWDPGVGLGTVTHQNIGYLFPMGPYYAVMDWLGLPDWIAQRIWMGSVIFLAGLGVRYLLKTLAWDGAGVTVASFAYALSPYLLHYIYKHSVILLPFTALPWLMAFTARSLRHGGWRYPSLFALVALASGGINATSLLLVLVGPLLWVLHAIFVEREITIRRALLPLLRIGLLTSVTSLWWIAGLTLQGGYGIDILRYTETYKTVASASTAPEVFRGFGYWFFYGTDALGPWFKAAVTETQSLPAVALSFAVPIMAVVAALLTRFRYRVLFVGLAVAGMVISVGGSPFGSSTIYGRIFTAFTGTESGLAMRSSPRAIPLWALAGSVFLGAGVAALTRWRPRWRLAYAGLALVAVGANLSPLWMGRMIDPYLERPEDVPAYWTAAGRYLDTGDPATRVVELPGIDFANYRWGSTVDPITPGLTDRDLSARELVPWGSPASADLTNAFDAPFQDASVDPSSLNQLLDVLRAGDVVARNDLAYERFRTPRPRSVLDWLTRGEIGTAKSFGPTTPNVAGPPKPMIDDTELATPDAAPYPAKVQVYRRDSRPIVDAAATTPTIVSGSGMGLVNLAEAGRLDGATTLYSGTVSDQPSLLRRLLGAGARLVVTDSNRKAAQRWGSLRDDQGYTEMADERPVKSDPSDNRLELFPDRAGDTDLQTVVEQRGGLRVRASDYGNQLTYTPGDRAAKAFDGDPSTSWKVGAFADVRGEWIEAASTTGPLTTDHVRLVQPSTLVNRWITRVRLTFDGGTARDVDLDASSRTPTGQVIDFGSRTFTSLRIQILATDPGVLARYVGISGVGFSEIDLDGRHVTEVVRPPTDLLDAVGPRQASHQLTYIFRRQRSNPTEPTLSENEPRIVREVDPGLRRSFTVSGKARLHSSLPDAVVDRTLGDTGPVRFNSSGRLAGDLVSRASKAFDGDPATGWQSNIGVANGTAWLGWSSDAPTTTTVTGLTVLDDAHHSVPTRAHFDVDGVAEPPFELTGAGTPKALGTNAELSMSPQTVTGNDVRLVFDTIEPRTENDWLSGRPVNMPLGVAEVAATSDGGPLRSASLPATVPDSCRTDLATIGDTSVALRVSGSTDDAEHGRLLTISPCGEPTSIAETSTLLTASDGATTSFDLDQVVLDSPAAGGDAAGATRAAPTTSATRTSRSSYDISIGRATTPFWLVLNQTSNPGWKLQIAGHDLGPSTLVNGYGNGWYVDPVALGITGRSVDATLNWQPQQLVWIALLVSGIGFLVCLGLLLPRFARPDPEAAHRRLMQPIGISPLDTFGATASVRTSLVATTCVGLLAVFIAPWWWMPPLTVLMFAALRSDWGWRALRVTVVLLLGVTAAFVVAKQWHAGYGDDFDWPQHFAAVGSLPLAAFVGLAADAVVEAIRGGWRRNTGLA